MIKVVYTYRTATQDLPKLMAKFAQSADPKFDSQPTNSKIEMFRRVDGDDTVIALDIYYRSLADFEARHTFEKANADWQAIWFSPDISHQEVSVDVFECL
ncbi:MULTISPECIES: hypothetical protein [unclassified Moraxella]|uniref:hypothetical protein n=1 Tax=unclassified Moraxella TaxID=2685852 RepID=UPI003AF5B509